MLPTNHRQEFRRKLLRGELTIEPNHRGVLKRPRGSFIMVGRNRKDQAFSKLKKAS